LDGEVLASLGEPIFPSPNLMSLLQDRLSQKKLLIQYKIPTAEFIQVDTAEDLEQATQHFPKGFVLKKRRGGYDGYGTFIVKSADDLKNLRPVLSKEKSGFIAEAFVPFKKELAVMLVRDQKNHCFSLPLVESKQTQAKCDWVQGPVKHAKAKSLITRLQKMLKQENYVGVIGFELFDTGSNLLINELAPRVHNSGHYSLDALSEDQFSLHIKAVCGFSCVPPKVLSPGFAMANLIGSKNSPADWENDLTSKIHWYGKLENRPGRKMGHLNAVGATPKKALAQVLKDRKKFSL
jgi:5-(carboxyamino)imidazole ribonucleotide synthase